MKQFLRYLFVVTAMLIVVVGDAWGECYVLDEQPSGYTINIYNSKSYDNISGPCATLSFKARRGIGINGLEVYEYVNGVKGEVKKITNSELKTSWQSYSYSLSRNATKVEFYNNGGIWKEIKEVKITQATYLDAPTQNGNVLKDNSISFGEDIYGNEAYVDVKLNWSNISALSCSFTKNDNSQFAAQVIDGNAYTGAFGTATVRVTYKRTNVNTHTATLVISSGSLSHTINLSGKTGEFTVLAKKKIDLLMNSTYAPSDVFDVYYMKGGEKVIISDYTIIPLTSQLADYVDGQIQTNYRTGNASFILSRIAKESCKALNETIFVEVKQSEAICYLIENKSTSANHQTGQNEEGTYSETYTLNGIGDKLSFKCKLNRDPDFYHYLTPQYSTTDSGNDFQDFPDSKISTDNGNEHVRSGLNIPLETKRIRFKRTAATAGTANFSIYEIYVSRKKDFSAPTTLTLPQATIGRPVSASFDLSWSTCSDEIVLVSTNSNFVLSKSSIDATSGRGTTTITVTYDANSGSQSGTIVIYDQSQKIEIPVSCEVKSKLATEIIYTGEQQYGEIADGILYPFYVKDENGNTVGAAITLATSNKDILSVDETKIYPHCGGYVTLTATYKGDETHEPASKEQQIFVLECYQHIVWDQDLRGFLTDDNGTINDTIELTAYAATESGVKTGTPVVYSLDTEAEKIAKLIDNHNGTYSLNVFGKGEGTITASISEYTFDDEQYYPNDYTRIVRVHKKGDPCEPYSLSDGSEYAISCTNTTKILSLVGLPENSMSIMAHAAVSSYVNDLTVDFSTEETGDNWIEQQKQNIHSGSENKKYTFTVPENAKRVRFRTGSTLNTYFHNIFIRQKTYLTPSVTEININSTVNQEYTSSFEVEYSNMPHVQYSITNNHNLGLSISPRNEDINTFCNENGTIRFTITGISLIPHEALTETLTITTAAGEQIPILITINAKLLETYSFDKRDGNWSDPANWTVNGSTPSTLPTASNPVVISQNVIVDNQAVAYGIEMQEGGYINIPSTSGLTVHAGGYTTSSQEPDLEITIDKEHAGYFRMYPNSLRTKSLAAMPQAQVNFTTRGNMNNGGNKDATWQYIGAPGSGAGMDLAHTTVLYLRSEEKGWVRQYTEWAQLTPFAGYALTQKEQETFTLYPQLLNENVTIPLTYTSNGMKGDNLWANSYMAPLDITKFTPEDFTGNVDYTFYLYNSGSWNDWSKDQSATNDANVYTPGRYYAINLAQIDATKDQTVIPPMQGVYMKAKAGKGGSITLNYEKHVWNNTQTAKMNTPLRVAGKEDELHTQSLDFQRVRLQVNSENSGADRMYIIQDSMATAGYDNGYDAPKLMADGLVNIYTNEPFGKMEISSTDHMDGMYIGFEAGEDSEYAMTFTSLLGDSLYLYDSQQDLIIEMVNDEQYHFIAEPYSVNDFRFQIMVAPELSEEDNNNQGGVTTNVDNISTPSVWVNQGKLYVTNSQKNSTIAIYTASGMLVAAPYTIKHTPCTINIAHLPAGVYVLRLNDQAYKFICE